MYIADSVVHGQNRQSRVHVYEPKFAYMYVKKQLSTPYSKVILH